jgi:dGTPase
VAADRAIRSFLFGHLYRHPRIVLIREDAGQIIRELFSRFFAAPGLMPEEWAKAGASAGGCEARRARIVCDYIAGMTDRYAVAEHRRLFEKTPDLHLRPPGAKAAVRRNASA